MTTAKVWVLKNKISGMPKVDDFKCIEEVLSECKEGDVIIEAEYFSVDPYIRYRIRQTAINSCIFGSQVARVIESKNENFPIGSYVIGYPGWRSHTYIKSEDLLPTELFSFVKLPDVGKYSKSVGLGVLGMPGNTAYFGFLELCQPKAGETVLVNAAAGAVGSLVCQIAKIKGCKVIAFAGSDDKVSWLKELGVDHAYNYKTASIGDSLKEAAPNGINCYFDNVGGKFTSEALPHMAEFGRISICGCISQYNEESLDTGTVTMTSPFSESTLLWKQLKIEGFIVSRWANRWLEGISQMKNWLDEGKLQFRESVLEGFENIPKSFISLFTGENFGKAIIKA